MKTVNKIDLPVLKDVVKRGKKVPNPTEISYNELQTQAFKQQLKQIIQACLETVIQEVVVESKEESSDTEQIVQARLSVALEKVMQDIEVNVEAFLNDTVSKSRK